MNTPFGHPMNTELYAEHVVFLLNLNALLYFELTTVVEVAFGPTEVMFENKAFVFGEQLEVDQDRFDHLMRFIDL
jgi:hypothetical protein